MKTELAYSRERYLATRSRTALAEDRLFLDGRCAE